MKHSAAATTTSNMSPPEALSSLNTGRVHHQVTSSGSSIGRRMSTDASSTSQPMLKPHAEAAAAVTGLNRSSAGWCERPVAAASAMNSANLAYAPPAAEALYALMSGTCRLSLDLKRGDGRVMLGFTVNRVTGLLQPRQGRTTVTPLCSGADVHAFLVQAASGMARLPRRLMAASVCPRVSTEELCAAARCAWETLAAARPELPRPEVTVLALGAGGCEETVFGGGADTGGVCY